ncbi:hypothetical protein DVH24_028625 [Malus domestica]|uniref:Uncharacterized protein n=1 Tax=Malus domestica TaxID=3750 RepID=A0A498IXP7_MALDO|nr:hypothetical protein DVH24_028625 [Malus domestica]
MLQLITCRRNVTNAPPALSASTAPGMSAPLNGEPTPLTEVTPTASQVPVSSTPSMSVQPLNARANSLRNQTIAGPGIIVGGSGLPGKELTLRHQHYYIRRYYFSLFLELFDISMPLIRAIVDNVSKGYLFFLKCLIGRSLGLVYTGIRQSLRWK